MIHGDAEEETWQVPWASVEQHGSRLANLVSSLRTPGSEFLLVSEASVCCWGFFLGTMLSPESGPLSSAPRANPAFHLGRYHHGDAFHSGRYHHGEKAAVIDSHPWLVFWILLPWPPHPHICSGYASLLIPTNARPSDASLAVCHTSSEASWPQWELPLYLWGALLPLNVSGLPPEHCIHSRACFVPTDQYTCSQE